MKKLTLKLAIAILTFLTGIVITGLLTIYSFRSTEKIQVSSPPVAVIKVKANPPGGWKKVDVNNKVSFYLPSDMQEAELLDQIGYARPPKTFWNKILRFDYGYIDKLENAASRPGEQPCELAGTLREQPMYRSSEVEISGRKATQAFWQSDKPKLFYMNVCFSDIGDGTILKLAAVWKDERSLDVAEQILGTIEFPQSKAMYDK